MVRCMLNIENDHSPRKYVVLLKPNCEFLMWELSTSNFYNIGKIKTFVDPFTLFQTDILKTRKHSLGPNYHRKIIEAWSNADEEVRLEYENLYSRYKISQLGTIL